MKFAHPTVALFLAGLVAAGNPAPRAQNPLGRPAATVPTFAATFVGKEITLELRADGKEHAYAGTLTFEGQAYACTADATGSDLRGTFVVGGQGYAFTATLAGDRLTLTSDGNTYALTRKGNPLGRGGAVPAPIAPSPVAPVPGAPTPFAAPTQPAAGDQVGSVGIAFGPNGEGEIVVKAILPGGPASKTGLQPGGVLCAVDGKDVDDLTPEQLRARLQGPVGSMVTLTIETEREVLDVVIQRGLIPKDAPPPPGVDRPAPQPGLGRGLEPVAPGERPVARTDLPAWLRAGARVTYWSGSASLPGVRSHLVLDDNGIWVDQTTGQRYSDQQTMGSGGMGYQQLNVVYAGADGIAVDARSYLVMDPQTRAAALMTSAGYVGSAEAIGDYWIHPAKLAALGAGNTQGMRIVRAPYTLEGKQYDAVAIRTDNAAGFAQYTYDLASGLCLASSTSSTGSAVAVADPSGTAGTGAGATMITHTHLLAVRQLELPWAGGGLPPALQTGNGLQYRGTYSTLIPGSPEIPFQFQASFQVTQLARGFLTGKLQTRLDSGMGMPQESSQDRVFGADMISGLFLPPAALANLRPNQVIDNDPITGVRTVVTGADGATVSLAELAPTQEAHYVYDRRSGLLTAMAQSLRNGVGTTVVKLQLEGQR